MHEVMNDWSIISDQTNAPHAVGHALLKRAPHPCAGLGQKEADYFPELDRGRNTATMANPQHTNGYPLPTNGTAQQGQPADHERRLRTIPVREALPFTPFSSIVPFDPGMRGSVHCLMPITCLPAATLYTM